METLILFVFSYLALGIIIGGSLAISVKIYKGKNWDRTDTLTIPVVVILWPVILIGILRR